ncbi:larval cuticle protein 2-like [Musca domestica]|uniref:Larval cuticle protein 2 n=1 Tax=Musca domestica TaxID=7370 RepID=A0A1I8MJ41_MUSDO|nr:larval cuticle protein 2 [Musca domestica]XP_058979636.1 larval cuticle protein 2-like [Musca domestica]
MLKFLILATLVAYATAAAVAADDVHAEVKNMHSDVRADGFEYALETSNYIREEAAGDEHGNMHGSYEYLTPEGEHVKVTYVADENGYHPEGAWIPTPPPIPDYILKAIEYIKAHPPKEEGKH